MHTLITGGSGFIGRALTAALIEQGHPVSVLTRSARTATPLLPAGTRIVERLEALQQTPQVIVNLAGENLSAGRWTAARKQRFVDSRIGTTRQLIDWIETLAQRPQALISGSAIGWYGPRGDESVDESATPGDDFSAQLCLAWEAEAQRAEGLGLRVCYLRTGIVLGADGGALQRMLPPFRLGGGGPMGSGRQWMSWIHRSDLVRMIQWLAQTPSCRGAYNGTAPQPAQNREFARALGAALHRPAVLPLPAAALRLIFGEMSDLLLTGQRVLPARAQREGFELLYPDLPGALTQLLAR